MDVLIVGGEGSFVHGIFAEKLSEVGIDVGGHWDWTMRRPPQVVPKGCKGVVVLHDMVGHHLSEAAKVAASTAGVPYVLVPRKFSAALPKLQAAGLAKVQAEVAPLEVDAAPVEDELMTWAQLVLEGNFTASDDVLVDHILVYAPRANRDEVQARLVECRDRLRAQWARKNRTREDDRSMKESVLSWIRGLQWAANDPLRVQKIRSEGKTLFGVEIPDEFLTEAGFQLWELKGAVTRDRATAGVQNGVAIYDALTYREASDIQSWVQTIDQSPRKSDIPNCPVTLNVVGRPVDGLTVLMLCAGRQLDTATAQRAYKAITGSSLGPGYLDATEWVMSNVELDMPKPKVPPPPVEVPSLMPVDTHLNAAPVTVLNVRDDLLELEAEINTAVDAYVRSVVQGSDNGLDAILALVNRRAAEQMKAELQKAESDLRTAEDTKRKARALLDEAEAMAISASERVNRLRGMPRG
jgi:hypothetical protein